MDIHHSYIKDFILPQVKSVIVTDYYKGIQGALSARKDFAYSDFFAIPRLRTKTEITWATEAFNSKPTSLSELNGDDKDYYSIEFKKRIEAVETLIETLNNEEDGAPLAEILKKAIIYVDEQSVYCAEGKVVLVNWGIIPRNAQIGIGGIYKNGNFVGTWNHIKAYATKSRIDNKKSDGGIEAQPATENLQATETYRRVETGESATCSEAEGNAQSAIVNVEQPKPIVTNASTGNKTLIMSEKDKADEDRQEQEAVNKERPLSNPKAPTRETEKPTKITDWQTLMKTLWTAIVFLLGKLWWLLLSMFVIFGLLYLCRNCQGPLNKVNPYYSPLPEHPHLLPIEDNEVGLSSDCTIYVAKDRLNIILKDFSDEGMLNWAKVFKKAYPGSEYEVYFYDKQTGLMQIKVPSDKQEQVKKEIKEKIPDIAFDVMYETVSSLPATSFNDPEFKNEAYSWYMRAIGVYNAWKTTLGSDEVIVAVVDNGFDLTHLELQGKIVGAYNVFSQNDNVKPIFTQRGEDAHGTHVAATAVGNINNGSGLSGIAPKCRLMPIQVANDNNEGYIGNQAILMGVEYAIDNGADVINVSLGLCASKQIRQLSEGEQLNFISSQLKYEEQLWNRIVEKARQHNCIIVVAAGNDNIIAGIDPNKRNLSTVRVSAVTALSQKAEFSNYGCYPNLQREYSSVSAPGVDIYNAAPHGKYKTMSGTSMAAPIVTGVVALLKSENRNLTSEQIIDILKRTGKRVDSKIGPMVNAEYAIRCINGDAKPKTCSAIVQRLRELAAEMDSLRRLCPDASSATDTLKYNDAVNSKYGLDGVWKSTTSLVATNDMTPIELYMEFCKLKGALRICNKGSVYTAPLTANIYNKKITIVQHKDAVCSNTEDFFCKYSYICSADRYGNLQCTATSKSNTVIFNLVKVK